MPPLRFFCLKPRTHDARRRQVDLVRTGSVYWATLTTAATPVRPDHHAQLNSHGRFVVGLALQYQNRGLSQEALLTAAHGVLVRLLAQGADPPTADRFLAMALRNAPLEAIERLTLLA